MYRTDFWTLWEKARVGWSERTALKQVYYQGWNRSPAQVGCMSRVLRAGSLGWPGGMGWGTHINPWLIHVSVWQKPLQYCKVISLQLIKINGKKLITTTKSGSTTLHSVSNAEVSYPQQRLVLSVILVILVVFSSVQLLSHVQLFATPWIPAHQASLSITNSPNLLKLMSIESVMPSNHLVLCSPLLLLPSIFPSIRVFSNESVLRIRWPKF